MEFPGVGRRRIVGRFDGGTLSSDAGALLLRDVEEANGFAGEGVWVFHRLPCHGLGQSARPDAEGAFDDPCLADDELFYLDGSTFPQEWSPRRFSQCQLLVQILRQRAGSHGGSVANSAKGCW